MWFGTVLWLLWQILTKYCKVLMPRPSNWGIQGACTILLPKEIVKYSFMCGSNFNETDVILLKYAE